jgi:hypothetical protein
LFNPGYNSKILREIRADYASDPAGMRGIHLRIWRKDSGNYRKLYYNTFLLYITDFYLIYNIIYIYI